MPGAPSFIALDWGTSSLRAWRFGESPNPDVYKRQQLDGFRRQVQDSFGKEAQERHTLTHEIRNLQQLNAQMAQEAINLTRALKGDNKTQGNWGEVVLTRVLEASGLREGYEYETQVSIENDARSRMQPDVIVRLPQGKDVVIDAKMTLVAYERYFNAEDVYKRQTTQSARIIGVRILPGIFTTLPMTFKESSPRTSSMK